MFVRLGAYQCVWVSQGPRRILGADALRWGCTGEEGLPGGQCLPPH